MHTRADALQPGQRFAFSQGPVAHRVFKAQAVTTIEQPPRINYAGERATFVTAILCNGVVFNVPAETPITVL
jgi:hypothetical protein